MGTFTRILTGLKKKASDWGRCVETSAQDSRVEQFKWNRKIPPSAYIANPVSIQETTLLSLTLLRSLLLPLPSSSIELQSYSGINCTPSCCARKIFTFLIKLFSMLLFINLMATLVCPQPRLCPLRAPSSDGGWRWSFTFATTTNSSTSAVFVILYFIRWPEQQSPICPFNQSDRVSAVFREEEEARLFLHLM